MFEALIFLPEPSYTSICRGWSVASGCVVGDGSALRSTWFFFSKYLFSEWIIHISPRKYYSLLCSGRVNVPPTVNRKTLIADDNSCCRRIKTWRLQAVPPSSPYSLPSLQIQADASSHRSPSLTPPCFTVAMSHVTDEGMQPWNVENRRASSLLSLWRYRAFTERSLCPWCGLSSHGGHTKI